MHVEKLTLSETRAILSHDLRNNKTYSNKNIDTEKRNENIVFNKRGLDYMEEYFKRQSVKIHGKNGKAKDSINYAVSVVLHYPEECNIPEKDFFKMAHIILGKKFGKDNIICSVVHRDEARSHLHFVFLPVVKDKKHNKKKLCCKEVVSREMLQHLHDDVEKAFKEMYGLDVKLQNEEKGQFKNIEHIEDYKKYKDLQKEVEQLKADKQELNIDNYILSNQIETLQKQIEQLENEKEEASKYYNDKKMTFKQVKEDIDKNYNEAVENYRNEAQAKYEADCKDVNNYYDSEFEKYVRNEAKKLTEQKKAADNDLKQALYNQMEMAR